MEASVTYVLTAGEAGRLGQVCTAPFSVPMLSGQGPLVILIDWEDEAPNPQRTIIALCGKAADGFQVSWEVLDTRLIHMLHTTDTSHNGCLARRLNGI